jgi:hypothetical protein
MRTWVLLTLFVIASTASAAAPRVATVKDWTFKDFRDGSASGSTTNGSGSTFGVYCGEAKQCTIFLLTDLTCDEGKKQIVLVNADSGAMAENTTCSKINKPNEKEQFALTFDDFDSWG